MSLLVSQKHSELIEREVKWNRINILLQDNENEIVENFCFKLPNESDQAYKSRKETFGYHFINTLNDLIFAQISSIFRQGLRIENTVKNDLIDNFIKGIDMGINKNISLRIFIQDYLSYSLKAYGTTFTVIDKQHYDSDNREDELNNGKPYLLLIDPLDVLNWATEDGSLVWFSYISREKTVVNDPVEMSQYETTTEKVHVITREKHYILKGIHGNEIEQESYHNYGFVPVVIKGIYLNSYNDTVGNSSISQTAKMIVNANFNLHLANYEIAKNGNSLLLMTTDSRSGMNRDIMLDGSTEMKKQDNDSILEYEGEVKPEYLIKDLSTREQIDLADYYFRASEDNEKNQKSVAKKGSSGQMVQESGFAKVIELQPIENNLIALSTALEDNVNRIMDVVARINGLENNVVIEFNKKYDLRTIKQMYEDMTEATNNEIKKISETAYKTMHKQIINKQFSNEEIKKEINKEIDNYIMIDEEDTEADINSYFGNKKVL